MSRSSDADFEILDKLGSGAFGTVFKVRREQDKEVYVIKEVRIEELTAVEQNEAINEVNILAGLDSRYIVAYFDSFIEGGSLKIVMEYCNRGDLQGLLRRAKDKSVTCLKENVTWNIGLQIILGLYYLHGQRVLHRDLKTANVFLQKHPGSTFFSVKIGDLGVAKLLETTGAFAKTIVGTPYYLSPELCTDEPYRDKSDCWALGVILYECCTLHRPFEARNQCALIMKIVHSDITPPPEENVSPELRRLITWLLQKKPDNRPAIKDLLRERFIQDAIMEHGFLLPDELYDLSLTDRLSNTIGGTLDTKPGDSSRDAENYPYSTSTGSDANGNTSELLGAAGGSMGAADAKESSDGSDSSFVRRHNEILRQEKEAMQGANPRYGSSMPFADENVPLREGDVDTGADAKVADATPGGLGMQQTFKEVSSAGSYLNGGPDEGYTDNDATWGALDDGRRATPGARSGPIGPGVTSSRRASSQGQQHHAATVGAGAAVGAGAGTRGPGSRQGNRVRGGAQAQRTPSSKAMTRYQVGGSISASTHAGSKREVDEDSSTPRHRPAQGAEEKTDVTYAGESGEGDSDFLEDSLTLAHDAREGGAERERERGRGSPGPRYEDDDDWHNDSMPRGASTGANVVPVYVETTVGGGQPIASNNLGNYATHGQMQAQGKGARSRTGSFENDHYDDDFEEYDEHQEEEEREFYEGGEHELSQEYIAHFGVPDGYRSSPSKDADSELTGRRDHKQEGSPGLSRAAGTISPAGAETEAEAEAEGYDEERVRDLTQRLTADLGPALFNKLYALCKKNMSPHDLEGGGTDAGERQVRHSRDSSYLQEINNELHAHKKAHRLAEVQQYVFSLKALCAFEGARSVQDGER